MIRLQPLRTPPKPHRGVTLIELLVVIGILTMLTGIALPQIRDAIRQQRITRAGWTAKAFIESARAKAISSGRSYGVVIERSGNDSAYARSHAVSMRIVHVPPSYSGDVGEAKAYVLNNLGNEGWLAFDSNSSWLFESARSTSGIRTFAPGDLMSVGFDLPPFTIETIEVGVASHFQGNAFPTTGTGPWTVVQPAPSLEVNGFYDAKTEIASRFTEGELLPYSITRTPVVSTDASLELREGAVIDLLYSGTSRLGSEDGFSPLSIEGDYRDDVNVNPALAGGVREYGNIGLVFSPRGNVEYIWRSEAANMPQMRRLPDANLFFLIGRADQVVAEAPLLADDAGTSNLLDPESVWLVINRQTGEVFTSGIDSVDSAVTMAAVPPTATDLRNLIQASRTSTRVYGADGL